jgi:hypothetical protein
VSILKTDEDNEYTCKNDKWHFLKDRLGIRGPIHLFFPTWPHTINLIALKFTTYLLNWPYL